MSTAHHDRYGEPNTVTNAGVGEHDGHAEAPHGTMKSLLTGFVLAAILTIVPFYLVMERPLDNALMTALIVVGFAAVQIVVHMVFFLHMDPRQEGGWTFVALIFTIIVLSIAVAGTLWVMYHMNANMMPTHTMDML